MARFDSMVANYYREIDSNEHLARNWRGIAKFAAQYLSYDASSRNFGIHEMRPTAKFCRSELLSYVWHLNMAFCSSGEEISIYGERMSTMRVNQASRRK